MRSRTRLLFSVLALVLLAGSATESRGQRSIREPRLKANPNRVPGAGGACVYDRDGKVVFAPSGGHCPDKTDHLSNTPGSSSTLVDSYPPAVRQELSQLLADHDHIAEEIGRLRSAVGSKDQLAALAAVEKIQSELTDHRVREERFFRRMSKTAR